MLIDEYDNDDVHGYVDKSMATQANKAHKQLSITELLQPTPQTPDKHHMETDVEQEVTLKS